jgi:hypothetical protein
MDGIAFISHTSAQSLPIRMVTGSARAWTSETFNQIAPEVK